MKFMKIILIDKKKHVVNRNVLTLRMANLRCTAKKMGKTLSWWLVSK